MPGISFHELAERELDDAAQYYERQSPGLGTTFIAEVERTTQAINQHPHAGASLPSGIQRRLLRRFPYALLYRVRFDRIRILGDEPAATTGVLGGTIVTPPKQPATRHPGWRRVAEASSRPQTFQLFVPVLDQHHGALPLSMTTRC